MSIFCQKSCILLTVLASVVCHPETAGGGLEYGWGKLKYEQRQRNDDSVKIQGGQVFINKIKELCIDSSILPMSRVWKFQRRARYYTRLYMSTSEREGGTCLTFEEIEMMRKKCKTHRNIMERVGKSFYS